ncbi:MAG: M24 family metallopeptidase [Hyphomicrobiales bacterium]
MSPNFAAFDISEHHERMIRARAALTDAKLDACVVVAPEHLYYFGGYDSWVSVNSPQAMLFTGGDDAPTLILRNVDLPLARETSWVEDIRTYHMHADDYGQMVRDVLGEKGVTQGRIGIELQSYALPHALGAHLAAALTPMEIADATELLGDLRLIKSPAEMRYLERAAHFAAQGLRAVYENLQPGISEIALAAQIESAMRRAGSDYWAIPTELASGARSAGGHATPRDKTIDAGELVHVEFAGVSQRYHSTALQTLAIGSPGAKARELYDIALASLRAGMAEAKPGAAVATIEEASLEPLRAHGLEDAAMMRFGYGIGIAYPPIWLETLQIARGIERTLEPGMVFVLHSCLELPDEGLGVVQGGTYALTATGLTKLVGAGDIELVMV